MKLKTPLAVIISLLILPPLSHGAKKGEIILGFGGGFSLSLDAALLEYEFDFKMPNDMYFKEQAQMKQCFNLNAQYFFRKELGLQLEFSQQKASYFSHLEWYGYWIPNPPFENIYLEFNHIEEPYCKPWSLSSLTLSLIFAMRKSASQRTYPYLLGGVGLYLLSGDEEFVLNRFRLGPKKINYKTKLGGGLKHWLNSKLGLNLRISLESIARYSTRGQLVSYEQEQFDLDWYFSEGKIGRAMGAIVNSFTYAAIDLSLEFRL